jgi:hypothetical protein
MKRVLYIGLLSLLVASCKKDSKCEKWRTAEECVPKRSGVVCGTYDPSHYIDQTLCGDKLNGVYPGASKVTHEDENAQIITHYLQKLQ